MKKLYGFILISALSFIFATSSHASASASASAIRYQCKSENAVGFHPETMNPTRYINLSFRIVERNDSWEVHALFRDQGWVSVGDVDKKDLMQQHAIQTKNTLVGNAFGANFKTGKFFFANANDYMNGGIYAPHILIGTCTSQ